jgi:hypothetical protein
VALIALAASLIPLHNFNITVISWIPHLLKAAGLVVLRRMANRVYCRMVDPRVLHVLLVSNEVLGSQKKR